jgi:hypothetical protein
MQHDIQALIPGFFELPEFSLIQEIDWVDIKPIDIDYQRNKFKFYYDAWIETGKWRFMGINEPVWPTPLEFGKQVGYVEDEFFDKVWDFMKAYPIKRLKVPPFDFKEFTRMSTQWLAAANIQWQSYFEWCFENVKAQNSLNYVKPGNQLKTKEGEFVFYEDKGKNELINSYPDYGVLAEDTQGWRSLKPLLVFGNVLDWIWGDKFWDWANGIADKIFQLVIEALKALYKLVVDLLPSLAVVLAIVAGVFIVYEVIVKEIDKNV